MKNTHLRYLQLAAHIAEWSKDTSMKVGAVITRPDNTLASVGYNGYPKGVADIHMEHRDYKLARTIHAELNAILNANESVKGCTIYITHPPCSHCAAAIIQAGITSVFIDNGSFDGLRQHWLDSFHVSKEMFRQTSVSLHYLYADGRDNYQIPWHLQEGLSQDEMQ
jgi:dCMP deaminase